MVGDHSRNHRQRCGRGDRFAPSDGQRIDYRCNSVSIAAAPASGKQRQVLELVVRNRDTAQRTITIVEGDGTTDYDLHKIVLPSGWSAIYGHDSKWKKYNAEGTEISVGEPGAPGTNGTNGSNGALSVIEAEIDFGTDAVRQKRITVAAVGVTPTSKIIVCQSANAGTGGSSDDSEAEPIHFSVTPGTDQFTVVATPLFGPVSGKFKSSISPQRKESTMIISGSPSNNIAEVNAASDALRVEPYGFDGNPLAAQQFTVPANPYGLLMNALNDQMLVGVRADRFGSLASALHQCLFHDSFEGTTIHANRWLITNTTMAATQASAAGVVFNSGAITTITTGYMLQSARRFQKTQRGLLQAIFRARLIRQNNSVMELGFGDAATFNGANTTGAYGSAPHPVP